MSKTFLTKLSTEFPGTTAQETAVALLWHHGSDDANVSLSAKQIADEMEEAGFAKQNISRLKQSLEDDKRIVRGSSSNTFRIKLGSREKLTDKYICIAKVKPLERSDSIIPFELVHTTRGYLEKITLQLNVSYDHSLYDCCAVMCRRLIETLIIEAYEQLGRADELRGPDGHFMMLSGLLGVIISDKKVNLGRNAVKGINALKQLGDNSAHNRRFNARKDDIDKITGDVRIAVEELLHLAKLI